MNKYGVSYNVFDGVELLEDSINYIREFVDHISIIFQTVSYWGTKLSQEEIDIVESLKERNLVDELIYFDEKVDVRLIETHKRNLGRKLAKENGCTHYMSMDCDEFYTNEEFGKMIDYHNNNPLDVSYMPIESYYKDTNYIIDSSTYMDGDLYVSGFFPVNYEIKLGFSLNIKVDPTRKPNILDKNKYKMWRKNEIKMHHLSYVRANIYQKVYNSFSKFRYKNNIERFKKIEQCYESYEINKVALSADGDKYNIVHIKKPDIILDKYYENLKILKNNNL